MLAMPGAALAGTSERQASRGRRRDGSRRRSRQRNLRILGEGEETWPSAMPRTVRMVTMMTAKTTALAHLEAGRRAGHGAGALELEPAGAAVHCEAYADAEEGCAEQPKMA